MSYGGSKMLMKQTTVSVQNYRKTAEYIPAHWIESRVVANGIEQHFYRTGGDKPAIILLHGINAGALGWSRVAKALETNFDVIMLDARGHGRSERVGEKFSFDFLVEDVADFIIKLGLNKPAVLGHSMGGVTAAMLAAKHPDLVGCLLIEDAMWGDDKSRQRIGNTEAYKAWVTMFIAYLENLKTQSHEERLKASLPFMPPGAAQVWNEEDYVMMVETQAQLDMALFGLGAKLWGMTRIDTPLSELVKQITCPILLTGGTPAKGGGYDPLLVEKIAANWGAGEHVLFENAGHLIHLDQFEQFVGTVEGFLQRVFDSSIVNRQPSISN
jgi:N-formylmaleamate deformylase